MGLIVLFSLWYSAVASVPQVPNTYHVTGTIYLPKSDIMEPFEAWFNADKRMSRIDYYGGKLCCDFDSHTRAKSRDRLYSGGPPLPKTFYEISKSL